ncbi:MAG: hypothetical protein M1823_000455 [Watsoniomyces obsoletus]|nr:MAG: hypothetical protein M1823_000455 [Watsoniomyces obsoletus]
MNIPAPGSTQRSVYLHKARWVLGGIFAPELVAYTAWSQWDTARKLTVEVNEILRNQESNRDKMIPNRKHPWTLVHSFFACMGGFVVDIDTAPEGPYINGLTRVSICAHGVPLLAELGLLPDLSAAFIRDKSKADNVAKTLAIAQASWLVLQCIGRAAMHLPLTLLEINTLAHVVCAFVIYFLWWSKPLDIQDPTVLEGDGIHGLCAAMSMLSPTLEVTDDKGQKSLIRMRPEIEGLVHWESPPIPRNVDSSMGTTTVGTSAEQSDDIVIQMEPVDSTLEGDSMDPGSRRSSYPNPPTDNRVTPDEPTAEGFVVDLVNLTNGVVFQRRIPETTISTERSSSTENILREEEMVIDSQFSLKPESEYYRLFRKRPQIPLDMITLRRWKLASQALRDHSSIWEPFRVRYQHHHQSQRRPISPEQPASDREGQCQQQPPVGWEYPLRLLRKRFINVKIQNQPPEMNSEEYPFEQARPSISVIILSIASAAYGGLHATAWNHYFVRPSERLYWRAAVIIVGISGMMKALSNLLRIWNPPLWPVYSSSPGSSLFRSSSSSRGSSPYRYGYTNLVESSGFKLLTYLIWFFFAAARYILVFQAFMSLRELPIGIYETPEWSLYLPHL